MAETNQAPSIIREVERTCLIIALHDAVVDIGGPILLKEGSVQVEITIEVPFPNIWKENGVSPNGVQRYELVRLDFPVTFPLDPPEFSFRSDFGRSLAHMQPWTTEDQRPVPCLVDADTAEFFRQQGIAGLLNQLILWLDNAAQGVLINPKHGWEPARRDNFAGYIVADAQAIKRHVNRRSGSNFSKLEYLRLTDTNGNALEEHARAYENSVQVNIEKVPALFGERAIGNDPKFRIGKSVSLIVWPGKEPTGELVVCDEYLPESVTDLASLKIRASLYGCKDELVSALERLAKIVQSRPQSGPISLAIILCARRPLNLINTDSPIELCSYFIDFHMGNAFPDGGSTPVRLASIRHEISPGLLRSMSGIESREERLPWTLIGCGSLGSKVALHLGRAGSGPTVVLDYASISPHNYARIALIPCTDSMQITSMGPKASLVAEALAGLNQKAEAVIADVGTAMSNKACTKQAWPKDTWAVVNTTASLRVRAALCMPNHNFPHRVIEAVLYAQGQMAHIATEGPNRNPNLHDIFAMFYHHSRIGSGANSPLFQSGGDELSRAIVGEGCGSHTMRMSDGRISLFAAGISEYVLGLQKKGLPEDNGRFSVAEIQDDDLGVSWRHVDIAPVTEVNINNGDEHWAIRIHQSAVEKMHNEVQRWPIVETGGILLGRVEAVSKTFHVVDVLEAPSDSTRSATEFQLGTEGALTSIDAYANSTNHTLYCLGTWHSHLMPSGASETDRRTAKAVALARLTPSILLIHTPEGFRAILADQTHFEGAV